MSHIKFNIDPNPEASNVALADEVNDAPQVQEADGAPLQDSYGLAPDTAQQKRLIADISDLPQKPKIKHRFTKIVEMGEAKVEKSKTEQNNVRAMGRHRYTTPLEEGGDDVWNRESIEVFKKANEFDTKMKTAIDQFKMAKTPEQVDHARRSIRDVADKMHDFLNDIHFYSIDRHPYTYSRQFNEMFIGIGKSMGELNKILSE